MRGSCPPAIGSLKTKSMFYQLSENFELGKLRINFKRFFFKFHGGFIFLKMLKKWSNYKFRFFSATTEAKKFI